MLNFYDIPRLSESEKQGYFDRLAQGDMADLGRYEIYALIFHEHYAQITNTSKKETKADQRKKTYWLNTFYEWYVPPVNDQLVAVIGAGLRNLNSTLQENLRDYFGSPNEVRDEWHPFLDGFEQIIMNWDDDDSYSQRDIVVQRKMSQAMSTEEFLNSPVRRLDILLAISTFLQQGIGRNQEEIYMPHLSLGRTMLRCYADKCYNHIPRETGLIPRAFERAVYNIENALTAFLAIDARHAELVDSESLPRPTTLGIWGWHPSLRLH